MDIGWLIIMLLVYLIPTGLLVFGGYKAYQFFTKGRNLTYTSMPKLTHITSKNLPIDIIQQLDSVNEKAQKLLGYYQDGQLNEQAIVGENQFLVKKILDVHLPEAIADYQRLDNSRANDMAVGSTGKTAKQLLNNYLNTINQQFDEMLDAMYEQNAQKLLATNRYLQSRFENSSSALTLQAPTLEPPNNG